METLQTIIQKSDLNPEEKKDFMSILLSFSDEDLNIVKQALEQSPAWVRKIYENYVNKRKSVIESNINSWETIVKEEQKTLLDIEK